MNKLKVYAVIMVVGLFAGCIAHELIKNPKAFVTNKIPNKMQMLGFKLEFPKANATVVEQQRFAVETVNKRGDKKVEPVKFTIKHDNEEIPVVMTPNDYIINTLGTWKMAAYGTYRNNALYANIGVLYEIYHINDINFGAGLGTSGILGTVGYNLSQNTEAYLGLSFTQDRPSPLFGIAVRF